MARNRVIYQSDALYVSEGITSTTTGKHRQLDRVQSANYSFNVARQDINQYGELARIDSIVLDAPTVSVDFSYYLTDGTNERSLGFNVLTGIGGTSGNAISGLMLDQSGRNLYILTSSEGLDYNKTTNPSGVSSMIGIGNVFLTDYTLDVAVGSLPTVSVSMEGSNITASGVPKLTSGTSGALVTGGYSGFLPSVDPSGGASYASTGIFLPSGSSNTGTATVSALRPGDVTLSFGNSNSGIIADITGGADAIHIQSASLSVPLSRSALQRLGSRYPYSRLVDFPLNVTLSVNAILNEVTAENLAASIDTKITNDLTLTIKQPNLTTNALVYVLKGCKLDSESFSSSIGSNKTVDLVFSTQIGGNNDTANGLFISGFGSGAVFQ
jgi:hypothetical protein